MSNLEKWINAILNKDAKNLSIGEVRSLQMIRQEMNRLQKENAALQECQHPQPKQEVDKVEGEETDMEKLREDLRVTEVLLEERQKLLDAIPECPLHGKCVPNALLWIEKAKLKM